MSFQDYAKEMMIVIRLQKVMQHLDGQELQDAQDYLHSLTSRLRSDRGTWEHMYAFFPPTQR